MNNNNNNANSYTPLYSPHNQGGGYHPSSQPQQVGAVFHAAEQSSHSHGVPNPSSYGTPAGQLTNAHALVHQSPQPFAQAQGVHGYTHQTVPVALHGNTSQMYPHGVAVAASYQAHHPVLPAQAVRQGTSASAQPPTPLCNICGQSFTRNGDLKRHRETVHSDRLHTCTICGKTYTRADSLTRHMHDAHQG